MKTKYNSAILVSISIFVWVLLSRVIIFGILPNIIPRISPIFEQILRTIVVPYLIVLPISYLILRMVKFIDLNRSRSYSLKSLIQIIVIQSGFGIFISFFFSSVLILVGIQSVKSIPSMSVLEQWYTIFLLLIFNPIFEEILFRRMVLNRLLEYGERGAVLLSAALFGLIHLISQGLPQMFSTFVLGIIWAKLTLKTNRLRYAIILHVLFNFWGFILPMFLMDLELGRIIFAPIWLILVPICAAYLFFKNRSHLLE